MPELMPEPTSAIRPEPTDDDLMRAFARGDPRAFERLYARHQQPLFRFVRRLMGQAAAAQVEEVFQDTWMRAIQARDSWAPQGASFRTWLCTIAHHRAIDCLRRSGREVNLTGDDEAGEPWEPEAAAWSGWPGAAEAPSGEELAFWRAAGQRLLDCLDQLPLAQRTAFLMHHDDGLSVQELARVLDLGFETAKTRLRYALAKLRVCMGAYLRAEASR
jgi:RNA polymerase sigma-70 factor (ECF subfamily)